MKLDPEERVLLTPEELKQIKEICDNPQPPTERMRAAVERYKKWTKSSK